MSRKLTELASSTLVCLNNLNEYYVFLFGIMGAIQYHVSCILIELRGIRVNFHVGCSPTRFQIIIGWGCSHVFKNKLPSNHNLAVHQNVEGCGHGVARLPCTESKPTSVGHRRFKRPVQEEKGDLTLRRRLVRWPIFERWEQLVDTYEPNPTILPLQLGRFVLVTLESSGQATHLDPDRNHSLLS